MTDGDGAAENVAIFDRLAPREREIAELSCNGLTSSEVAERLGIKPSSVRTTLHRVYAKLNVTNLLELKKLASNVDAIGPVEPVQERLHGSVASFAEELSRSVVVISLLFLLSLFIALPNTASDYESTLTERLVCMGLALLVCSLFYRAIKNRLQKIRSSVQPAAAVFVGAMVLLALVLNQGRIFSRFDVLLRMAVDLLSFILLLVAMWAECVCFFGRHGSAAQFREFIVEVGIIAVCSRVACFVADDENVVIIAAAVIVCSCIASLFVGTASSIETTQEENFVEIDGMGRIVGLVIGLFLGVLFGFSALSIGEQAAGAFIALEACLLESFFSARISFNRGGGIRAVFTAMVPFAIVGVVLALFGMDDQIVSSMVLCVAVFRIGASVIGDDLLFKRVVACMGIGLLFAVFFLNGTLESLPTELFAAASVSLFTIAFAGLLLSAMFFRKELAEREAYSLRESDGFEKALSVLDARMVIAGCNGFQREAVLLSVQGKTAREIGEQLGYSASSVKAARAKVCRKLKISNIGMLIEELAGQNDM